MVRLLAESGSTVPPQGTLGIDYIHINVANPYKHCGRYIIVLTEHLYGLPADTAHNDTGTSIRRASRRARNISKLAYTCDFRDDTSDFSKEEFKDFSPEATSPRRGPGRRKRKRIPSMRIRLLGRNEGTNSPIFSAETLDVSCWLWLNSS